MGSSNQNSGLDSAAECRNGEFIHSYSFASATNLGLENSSMATYQHPRDGFQSKSYLVANPSNSRQLAVGPTGNLVVEVVVEIFHLFGKCNWWVFVRS